MSDKSTKNDRALRHGHLYIIIFQLVIYTKEAFYYRFFWDLKYRANKIVFSPILADAFYEVTGIALEGSTAAKRQIIKSTAREYAYSMSKLPQLQAEASKALTEHSRAESERQSDLETAANAPYDSYIRGIIEHGGNYSEAGEIARNPQLRAVWERMTGANLPNTTNKARKMIMSTRMDVPTSQMWQPSQVETQTSLVAETQPIGDISTPPAAQNVKQGDSDALNSAINYNSREAQTAAPSQAQKNTAPTQETVENTIMRESDLPDYMATGVRQHVRNAKDAQLKNGGSPILTTIEQIKGFIRSSLRGETADMIKGYGKVGSRMAQDISDSSDGKTDVRGYYLELDGNRIRHMKDHVDTDSDGRNVPLTSAQAEQLTEYIDNYDEVLDVLTRKDGSTKVYLSKDTGDGHVVIVELVSKGRQSLQPVTAWQNTYEAFENIWGKKKEVDSASQDGQTPISRGYQPTSDSGGQANPPSLAPVGDTGAISPPITNAQQDANVEDVSSDISIPTDTQNVKQNFEGEKTEYRSNLGKGNGTRTTQTVETINNADITTDARREQISPYVKNGKFDYIPDTNKAQTERAARSIARNGWSESAKDFHDAVIKGKSGNLPCLKRVVYMTNILYLRQLSF